MIEILMDYSRFLEIKKPEPQPRRHKCGSCGNVFVCDRCTKVMNHKINSYTKGLWAKSCSVPGKHGLIFDSFMFLCSKCR